MTVGDRDRVWVVASGEYSDYRVLAVFHSKAAAERAAATKPGGYDGYTVETLPVCGEGEDPAEMVTSYHLMQQFWDDGTHGDPHVSVSTEPWFDQMYAVSDRPRVRFVRAPVHNRKGGRLEVRGTDQAAVMKAANDRKAMLLAHCDLTGKVGPEVNA